MSSPYDFSEGGEYDLDLPVPGPDIDPGDYVTTDSYFEVGYKSGLQ
jgi:hypothetical protein